MPAYALDHVTIATTDLQATIDFYVSVLGLTLGARPDFDFPGAWIYAGNEPVVHVIERGESQGQSTGALDHIAFRATNIAKVKQSLQHMDIPFTEQKVPGTELHQIFVVDPNGIKVELNFDMS